jgi:ABC-type uncharacterized transport system substrate-binding protein
VKTGRDMNGWTEILDDRLAEGTPVVTMGQQLVEEGTLVAVVKEDSR